VKSSTGGHIRQEKEERELVNLLACQLIKGESAPTFADRLNVGLWKVSTKAFTSSLSLQCATINTPLQKDHPRKQLNATATHTVNNPHCTPLILSTPLVDELNNLG
jgi:hypothetical protein